MSKTELTDRTLWADGVSVVTPARLEAALISGIPLKSLAVTELTDEVRRFNMLADVKIDLKDKLSVEFPPKWNIPREYLGLDLDAFLYALPLKRDELYDKRVERLALEIALFEEHDLFNVLRVLIYIIEQFRAADIVWGTGRGSSCSSYILYLIGLHAVDPVRYDIDIHDFIR